MICTQRRCGKKKTAALEDASTAFQNQAVESVELRRWHDPRVGNRGQVDSWESEGGRDYDEVILEVIRREAAQQRLTGYTVGPLSAERKNSTDARIL
jgi:hypothetical protein